MSLGINTTTPEGIVLASDSRQSYRNRKGASRIGSESASKVYKLGKRVGLVVAGLAFFEENGIQKNISKFIEEFRRGENINQLEIQEIGERLYEFFKEKYKPEEQAKKLEKKIKQEIQERGGRIVDINRQKEGISIDFETAKGEKQKANAIVDQLQFIVAGYGPKGVHQVALVYVPGGTWLKRDGSEKGKEYGAGWIGQTDVVSRMILGFDGRIINLPAYEETVSQIGKENLKKQLAQLEYAIQWGTMTLQDAIDFSTLAIETTTAIQRFSDGIIGDPGEVPGVGGPIDVAVITQDKGFIWLAKKNLVYNEHEVDIDEVEDVA